jgi:16S rRNA U516 pseudouridylate synthase RsuA-like enzyme
MHHVGGGDDDALAALDHAASGLQLTALRRLRLGRIALAGLPVGEWRYLLGYERF